MDSIDSVNVTREDLVQDAEQDLTQDLTQGAEQDFAQDIVWDELSPQQQEELFDEGYGDFILAIRSASQEGRLIHMPQQLDEFFHPEISYEQFCERDQAYRDDEELSAELEFTDLKVLELSSPNEDGLIQKLYYSSKFMADNWAKNTLLMLEQNNLATFVQTVRYESEIYPRPMLEKTLLLEPFCLSQDEIYEAFEQAQKHEAYQDIHECYASNKDHYYYSDRYLSKAQAEALAEFYSVERIRNV